MKFYICEHCGNIIAMIRDCGAPVYCCGEKMKEIRAGITDGAGEKHIPVYKVDGKTVTVNVGDTAHPMETEHYIEWICMKTNRGVQYRMLKPGDKPYTAFALCESEKPEAVYAFCNKHSLWKS